MANRRLERVTTFSPWRSVVGFGIVSLAADMVYEGARSVTGPLLLQLGGTALVGGILAGGRYERSLPLLVALVAATQVAALVLYVATLRGSGPGTFAPALVTLEDDE